MNTAQLFSLTRDPVFAQINDEIVVMSPKDEQNYAINAVGTELWTMLESQPMTIEAMVLYLKETYDVEETQAMTDVNLFIQSMMAHDLMTTDQS